jgi:hypothetical protein
MAAITGCGANQPPSGPPLAQAYPVQGRVIFANQAPLRGGVIYFTPSEVNVDGLIRYEAAGLVDGQGRYKLGFNGDHSGAPAGDCKVSIQPRDYQELPNSNTRQIPARYRDSAKTPLQATVKEGENVLNFVLK